MINILSEEAHNFLSDNVEGILLYSILITVALLIVFFKRSKIRADYKKWKKWKFKVFGVSGEVEKNEDKMFEELWEENEKNASKVAQLSKHIKAMSQQLFNHRYGTRSIQYVNRLTSMIVLFDFYRSMHF